VKGQRIVYCSFQRDQIDRRTSKKNKADIKSRPVGNRSASRRVLSGNAFFFVNDRFFNPRFSLDCENLDERLGDLGFLRTSVCRPTALFETNSLGKELPLSTVFLRGLKGFEARAVLDGVEDRIARRF
jgi:hypothetical protein